MVRDIMMFELAVFAVSKYLNFEKIPSVAVNSADPRVSLFKCIVV